MLIQVSTFLGRSETMEGPKASAEKVVPGCISGPAPIPKGAVTDDTVGWKLGPSILPNIGAECPEAGGGTGTEGSTYQYKNAIKRAEYDCKINIISRIRTTT